MEGNPKDAHEKNHVCIFQLKTSRCLAFNGDGDNFYLMDEHYIIYNLTRTRNKGERMLSEASEHTLKEI